MATPTLITELSTTAAANAPAGSDSPSTLDDIQRAHASFIAQLRDADALKLNAAAVSAFGLTLIDDASAAAARTTLGAAASGANSDILSLTGLTTPLSMALGGTGMANGFVSSKAASGYQRLPSGLIIQWVSSGLVSCAAATSTPISATLPIAFPTAALFAFANLKDIGVAGANTGPWVASSTLSAVSASVNMQSAQSVSLGFLVIGH